MIPSTKPGSRKRLCWLVAALVVVVGVRIAWSYYGWGSDGQVAKTRRDASAAPPISDGGESALDDANAPPEILAAERELEALWEKYPADRFPNGHAELTAALDTLSALHESRGEYARALSYCEQAFEMCCRLYPTEQYPNGHPDVAASLGNLAQLCELQANYALALSYHQRSLQMLQSLYPSEQFPDGHPDLAMSLSNLAILLESAGDYARALQYCKESLEMRQSLYPVSRFPQGHPAVSMSLNNLGSVYSRQGDYAHALSYYEQALELDRKAYPVDQYPGGHPDLALLLNNLASLYLFQGDYDRAESRYDEALEMLRAHYSADQFPNGHPNLASTLANQAMLYESRGDLVRALSCCEQALEMRRKLYPQEEYPEGHPHLANSLNSVALLLATQGEHARALSYCEASLKMRRNLFSQEKYPQGHPDLASSLNNLSEHLESQNEYERATPYCEEALEMYRRLYPAKEYPFGHPEFARVLNSRAGLLAFQRQYARALPYFEQSVDMHRKLYPPAKYPLGHPALASSLRGLAGLLASQQDYAGARRYGEQSLEMCRTLYPRERYPQGHPDLVTALIEVAVLCHLQSDYATALVLVEQSLAHEIGFVEEFASVSTEAHALNRMSESMVFEVLSFYLQSARDRTLANKVYAFVLRSKAAVSRVIRSRSLAWGTLTSDEARRDLEAYQAARRRLSGLYSVSPVGATPEQTEAHRKLLDEANDEKESLERKLAASSPEFRQAQEERNLSAEQLGEALPERAALIDLLRYTHIERQPDAPAEAEATPHYVAFVLSPAQPVARVELGAAAPIEDSLRQWRQAIQGQKNQATEEGEAARARLRELLWQPIEAALPSDTANVVIAPDGPLSSLPWGALPGREAGAVLLEDYAISLVPDAPFVWEQLTWDSAVAMGDTRVLAVGAVDYGKVPKQQDVKWPALGAADEEVNQVTLAAGDQRELNALSGGAATTQAVLDSLPQCHIAHLATHGFFSDPTEKSAEQLAAERGLEPLRMTALGERVGVTGRNPLLLSGIVLAGANLPPRTNEYGDPQGDGGILTAEAIAGLNLHQVNLVTLSACETGLGDVAGGEGVFGLQRAFHMAGADSVVASLWIVDDEATQALMKEFYENLWQKKLGKGEALRQAQLTMLRTYDWRSNRSGPLADRAPTQVDPAVEAREYAANPSENREPTRTPPYFWASFILSGDWR